MSEASTSRPGRTLARATWPILLALALSFYLLRQVYDGPYGKDFTIFLTGARVILSGEGAHLYDLDTQAEAQRAVAGTARFAGDVLPFNYPPYVAALFLPAVLLPPGVAYYLWVAILLALVFGLLLRARVRFRAWGLGPAWQLPFLLLAFQPILEAILMGQMSIVLLALWWWAFVSWREEKWGRLGVAVALAAFKPQMALLLLVGLAARKRWRALAFFTGTQAALWGAAVVLLGPDVIPGYVKMLQLSASTVGTLGFYPAVMPNLRGLVLLLGLPPEAGLPVAMGGWLASVAAAALIWRRIRSVPAAFGITAVLAVLLSPHLYIHDASLLALAPLCAAAAGGERASVEARLQPFLIPYWALFTGIYLPVLRIFPSFAVVIAAAWLFGATALFVLLGTARRAEIASSPGQAQEQEGAAVSPGVVAAR